MKLTTIFSSAIAAVGLAACGSTAVTPPTARPTLSLAAAPTVASTPPATPAPTPTPTPPTLVLAETCDGSGTAANDGGSVSFTGDDPGFDFVVYGPGLLGGWAGATTADASGDGTVSDLTVGDYEFNNLAPADAPGTLTGSFTIVQCAAEPTPTPCVVNPDSPNGSCETPPVVVVTGCAEYAGTTQFGGTISWSGADSADSFTIFDPGDNGYGNVLYTNGNTPPSGTYGPLGNANWTYQFVDNTDEIFNGSFTILTCAVPNA